MVLPCRDTFQVMPMRNCREAALVVHFPSPPSVISLCGEILDAAGFFVEVPGVLQDAFARVERIVGVSGNDTFCPRWPDW